jgi:K+-transporting ATPase A subunit
MRGTDVAFGFRDARDGVKEESMLWTIVAILFALWLLGLIANVGGGLIHLLLVVALVVFVVNLLTGRRTVV